MFDLNRTYANDYKEYPVAAGQTITEEGQILIFVDDGAGAAAVQPCAGAAAERVAGYAITDALKIVTEVVVEEVTVPAGGGTVNLRNQNIVAASERVFDVTAAAALTEVCPVPGAGQYCLTDATGVITFNVAEAGNTVRVTYRYNLTLEQTLNKHHERSINNRAQDLFSTVSVGALEGQLFTSMFDSSVAYAVGDPVLTETGGLATTAAGGKTFGFVIQVPSVADAFLGIKFQIPVS